MSENTPQPPIELGIYRRYDAPPKVSPAEKIAMVLSVGWVVVIGLFFVLTSLAAPELDSLRFVMTLMAIFLPVAMIWVVSAAHKSSRIMREESSRLQAAIDAMRKTYLQTQQTAPGMKPAVERKLEEIAAAQRKTESAIAMFTSIRPEAPRPAVSAGTALPQVESESEEQGKLALGTSAEEMRPPVNVPDFIRALNFPENAEDKEGFRALRRALQDRQTAKLVQASQDVLTMLSHDGIYMDDMRPDRARPEIWRMFAEGSRGRTIAALGGVRDRSCLALTTGRMRQDPVFRDAAHHFLRTFDSTFSSFAKTASDQDISALGDTRTARAFMLLGRVTGIFD